MRQTDTSRPQVAISETAARIGKMDDTTVRVLYWPQRLMCQPA
jgi:hypothetical protein